MTLKSAGHRLEKGNCVINLTQEEIGEIFEIRISLGLQVSHILVSKRLISEKDFTYPTALTEEMMNGESNT